MRAALNRTTLLDLDARREQALEVVTVGIRDAEAGGLGRTYGSFLRGNAADILYQLGRWAESEAECRAGMEWQPTGVAWFSPTLYLGLVLVESRADDEAEDLVGQTLLQLDTVPAGQWTALVQRAAVSFALWHGDHRGRAHGRAPGMAAGARDGGRRARSRSPRRPAWKRPPPPPRTAAPVAMSVSCSEATELADAGAARGGATGRRRVAAAHPGRPGGGRAAPGHGARASAPGPGSSVRQRAGRVSPRPGRTEASRTRPPRHAGGRRSPSCVAAGGDRLGRARRAPGGVAPGQPAARRARCAPSWPISRRGPASRCPWMRATRPRRSDRGGPTARRSRASRCPSSSIRRRRGRR